MTDEPGGEVVDLHRRSATDDLLTRQLRALAGSDPASPGDGEAERDPDEIDAHDMVHDPEALLRRLGSALPEPPKPLRLAIVVLAVLQLAVVLPWLANQDPFGLLGSSTAAHLARDGALGLAVAAAGLLAGWRHRYAIPCFVIGSVALVAQTVAGLFDSHGRGGSELVHLPSVILTCLVGLSAIRFDALGPRSRPDSRRH